MTIEPSLKINNKVGIPITRLGEYEPGLKSSPCRESRALARHPNIIDEKAAPNPQPPEGAPDFLQSVNPSHN